MGMFMTFFCSQHYYFVLYRTLFELNNELTIRYTSEQQLEAIYDVSLSG